MDFATFLYERVFIGIAMTNGLKTSSYKPDLKNVRANAILMYGDVLPTSTQKCQRSNLTALFLYEHTLSTRIQKRRKLSVSYAIGNESEPTGVPQVSFFTL